MIQFSTILAPTALAMAMLSAPVIAQSLPALDGTGSSSQTLSIGDGAVVVTIDAEGSLDTTGPSLLPDMDGSLAIDANGSDIGLGGNLSEIINPPKSPGDNVASSPDRPQPIFYSGLSSDAWHPSCPGLPVTKPLDAGMIAALSPDVAFVAVSMCAPERPITQAQARALGQNAALVDLLGQNGIAFTDVAGIGRSRDRDIYIYLARP